MQSDKHLKTPPIQSNPIPPDDPIHLQLHIIVHQPDLLARLECRQTNIRTPVAAERISQRTIATRAHFALHCEIHFSEIVRLQFRSFLEFREVGVGGRPRRGVFGVQALGETAAAVLAGAATFGVGFAGFGCGEEC